jgi:hypothetical protein
VVWTVEKRQWRTAKRYRAVHPKGSVKVRVPQHLTSWVSKYSHREERSIHERREGFCMYRRTPSSVGRAHLFSRPFVLVRECGGDCLE